MELRLQGRDTVLLPLLGRVKPGHQTELRVNSGHWNSSNFTHFYLSEALDGLHIAHELSFPSHEAPSLFAGRWRQWIGAVPAAAAGMGTLGIPGLCWWHSLLLKVTECRLGWLWCHFCTATAALDASLPLCTAGCSW